MAYASIADFSKFVNAELLNDFSDEQIEAAIDAASQHMDSYFRSRYTLPFATFGADVTNICCHISLYNLLILRGFNPQSGSDQLILTNYNNANSWLLNVAKQQIHPNVTSRDVGSGQSEKPKVSTSSHTYTYSSDSSQNRGW